jgi:hypothetical protein
MTNRLAIDGPNPNTSSKKIRRSKAQWQTIIQEFEQSGLSGQDFCRDKGLAQSSFYKWCSLLKNKSENIPAPPSFLEITPPTTTASNPAQDWTVELCLGRDVIVRIR